MAETSGEALETADFEILIGETPRVESEDALDSIGGDGWTIRVTDYKIAIVGTSMLLTKQALDYFAENYIVNGTVTDKTFITVPQKISNERMDMITLIDEGEIKSVVVYPDGVDTEAGYAQGNNGIGMGYDYPFQVANTVKSLFRSVGNLGDASLAVQPASAEVPKKTVEITVGETEGFYIPETALVSEGGIMGVYVFE